MPATLFLERLLASLPAEAARWPVRDVRLGECWTAVAVETSRGLRCGLAATLRSHPAEGVTLPPLRDSGPLGRRNPLELAALARSKDAAEASVGLATINALIEVDQRNAVEMNAKDVILARGAGRRVAIVGHFPFVPLVREVAAELWVLELRPQEGDLPADQAGWVIPQADVVALTGTTLLNHTFDALVALCRPDAYVLILGGTAPVSPLFFDYGVDLVGGAQVIDIPTVLDAVGHGVDYRHMPGRRYITLAAER